MSKKVLFLIGVLCFCWGATRAQSVNQNEVLKQCTSLEGLLQKLPDEFLKSNALFILDHGVDFNFSKDLKVNKKNVMLVTKADLKSNPAMCYFLFHTLNVEKNKARVVYSLNYKQNGKQVIIPTTLEFVKNAKGWVITNSKIKKAQRYATK